MKRAKKDKGDQKKKERRTALQTLTPLVGKKVGAMTKAEQESLLIVLLQMAGLVDDAGKVKEL